MLKQFFNNIYEFFSGFSRLKEISTIVGLFLLIFGWEYRVEINRLIINILTSNNLSNGIANSISNLTNVLMTAIGVLLVAYIEKNNKK